MKIAVCISGQLRNFEQTYYRLSKYLFEPLSPDIFFYGITNKQGFEQNSKTIKKLYSPKKYFLYEEDPQKLNNINLAHYVNKRQETDPYKIFYQYYNLKNVMELKTQYEKENNFEYDLVIRTRCDHFWFRSLVKKEIDDALILNNIIIPTEWDFKDVSPYGTTDMFAAGSSATMNLYATFFDKLHEYYTEVCMFHPETMLGYHLLKLNLNRIPIVSTFSTEPPSAWKSLNMNHEIFEFEHNIDYKNRFQF